VRVPEGFVIILAKVLITLAGINICLIKWRKFRIKFKKDNSHGEDIHHSPINCFQIVSYYLMKLRSHILFRLEQSFGNES